MTELGSKATKEVLLAADVQLRRVLVYSVQEINLPSLKLLQSWAFEMLK